jgi:hypothetical protein
MPQPHRHPKPNRKSQHQAHIHPLSQKLTDKVYKLRPVLDDLCGTPEPIAYGCHGDQRDADEQSGFIL